MKLDLHIGYLKTESLDTLDKFGYDIVFVEDTDTTATKHALSIYKFKYNPEKEWGVPIIKIISGFQFREFFEFLKSHPNRIRAAVFDLKDLRSDLLTQYTISRASSQFLRRGIPVFFSSGARTPEELVPPKALEALTKFLLLHRDINIVKAYKNFLADLPMIVDGGNYFEAN